MAALYNTELEQKTHKQILERLLSREEIKETDQIFIREDGWFQVGEDWEFDDWEMDSEEEGCDSELFGYVSDFFDAGRVGWKVVRLYEPATNEETGDVAILPNDDLRGLIIGSVEDLISLRDSINGYLSSNDYSGMIDRYDERLGVEWITVTQVHEDYGVPLSTARTFPKKITGSHKRFGRWYMPAARVRSFIANHRKRKKER